MTIRNLALSAAFLIIAIGLVVAVSRDATGGFILFLLAGAVIGGVVSLALRARSHRHWLTVSDAFADSSHTDVINMSHIRVAGIGGLGMVIVAAAIAIALPRIGQSLLLGAVGGAVIATLMIMRRRREGPLNSSHAQPGGRSVLVEPDVQKRDEHDDVKHSREELAIV
jgi:hypothetical protein